MEAKRQVGIKTRSVKRLAADVKSYETERTGYQTKLDTLGASPSSEAHELKRAREFVEEADSTLQDVRQRLQEAYTGLHNYLRELTIQNDAELLADQCMVDARQMLADVVPLVTVAGSAASSAAVAGRIFKISVFGGSQLNEDDALWRTTEELGERLAREAYHIVSGGYTGTSESLSFGASRIADSKIEGVTLASSSASSSSYASVPNQYLTVETKVGDQLERVTTLVRQADAFVVLPGGLGTLSKLTLAWNVAAAASPSSTSSSSNGLVILAWRAPWESLIESLSSTLGILPEVRACIRYVDSVDEIVRALDQMKQEHATATAAAAK